MALRNYSNTVNPTSLTTPASNSATTLNVASTAGFPSAPFTVGVDRGTPDEEAMLVTAVTATTMTVVRGYDGTTGMSHEAAAAVEHCVIALDYTEANLHIEDTGRDDHSQYLNQLRVQDHLPKTFTGSSQQSASPFTTTYKEVNRVTVPAVSYARRVQVQASVAVALGPQNNTITLAIRSGGTTHGAGRGHNAAGGFVGTISAMTEWMLVLPSTAVTYQAMINRAAGSGGAVETSPNLNTITALAVRA